MKDLEHRLEEYRKRMAAAIPGYLGYRKRERRRDADRQLRSELARRYGAQADRLADLQRRAADEAMLAILDDMERASLKLQRFVDRLRTASYGYAGWFESAAVREPELEQLYAFDQALTAGVEHVSAELDNIAEAIDEGAGVEPAVNALANVIDELNRRFDQRRELLAEGRKVPPNELQEALEVAQPPSPTVQALADLKLDDALSYDGTDYLIVAKVTYDAQGSVLHAYQIEDSGAERWLRVNTEQEDVALFDSLDYVVTTPPDETLEVAGESFRQTETGKAKAHIVGPGGRREGLVEYWLYVSESGNRLWIEQWGSDVRVHPGRAVDVARLQVWSHK